MDDEQLGARFRATAADSPPPSFGYADVVAASRRATLRRRSAVAGGAVAALLVIGGAGAAAVGGLPAGRGEQPVAAAAPAPREAADLAAPAAPTAPPGLGDPDGCGAKQGAALRAVLDAVLPEVRTAPEAPRTAECRPGGGREVHLEVTDGAARGLLSVIYSGPGVPPPEQGLPVGWQRAGAPTASGGYVSVTSRGAVESGAVPFAGRLQSVADALAPRL
ncbi:hypothetical protein [Pseudonocardia asaccharolytica]|uniref:Uncharacterized protein n=1 Tax=Pseudonocardia asaccharolytica DSM 44247 = NBRC 16224 TaxID=1123024 RepID=A0A511D0B5_9PSEU|nr:hypothetical protein [Pseudonocardia asaccharolytica]GEL18232.1 hypothetical protein PA7_20690 [Pseudonocardia asaccharolytica DSM 44247 = NBRC 16224]